MENYSRTECLHHRNIPSTLPALQQKPSSLPLPAPAQRCLYIHQNTIFYHSRGKRCLFYTILAYPSRHSCCFPKPALEKLSLVSAAMLTMCSTMTATRMLIHPKFRKMTDILSKVQILANFATEAGQLLQCCKLLAVIHVIRYKGSFARNTSKKNIKD